MEWLSRLADGVSDDADDVVVEVEVRRCVDERVERAEGRRWIGHAGDGNQVLVANRAAHATQADADSAVTIRVRRRRCVRAGGNARDRYGGQGCMVSDRVVPYCGR